MLFDDPSRRWTALLCAISLIGAAAVAAAGWWAFSLPVASIAGYDQQVRHEEAARPPAELGLEAWKAVPWRAPEEKPSARAPDKPWELRVVGLFAKDGKTLAAVEVGRGQPLVFIAAGQTKSGITVHRIDGQEVDVEWSGRRQIVGANPK